MTTFLLRATACALFADGWLLTLDVLSLRAAVAMCCIGLGILIAIASEMR